MNIRNWYEGDTDLIQRREGDEWFTSEWCEYSARYGRAFTFMEGDMPVAVMGIFKDKDGQSHVWAVISDYVRGKGLAFTREVRGLLDKMEQIYGPSACMVREDSKEYQRWAELLGFKQIRCVQGQCQYKR